MSARTELCHHDDGTKKQTFIRNGEKWTRIPLSRTAGGDKKFAVVSIIGQCLYPWASLIATQLSGLWAAKWPEHSSPHSFVASEVFRGQPARQCEQNIPKMRVEIGSGWDISCCQEVICIKHFLSAEKLLEKEWLFWVKSTILCLFAFVPWSPSWPNISPLVYHVLACCSGLLTSNISIYCGARSVLSTMYILLLFP